MAHGKSTVSIAIMAVANNIPKPTVKRFLWGIGQSEKKMPFDVVIGQHKDKNQKFYKTVILNDILRQIIKKYDVIVQTDIDMLIPPLLIRNSLQYCMHFDGCFHCNYYLMKPEELKGRKYKNINWNEIAKRKVRGASGSWNAMRNYMWNEAGGFSEAVALLGGPDSEFYLRSKKRGMHWHVTTQFPLAHINHSRRKVRKQGKRNLAAAKKFPIEYNWLKNRSKSVGPTKINIISFGK